MVSKLFIEEGDYICKLTGEPRNMMVVEIAYTPEMKQHCKMSS